jgi:hypothetical protein
MLSSLPLSPNNVSIVMSLCVIVSNKNPNFSIYSALHLRFYYYVYFLLYCLLLRADLSRSYYCSLTCSSTTLIQPYYLLSMQRAILLPFLLFVHATSHFATRSCNQLFCYSFMQPAILLLVHATSYSATRSCNHAAILLLVHATSYSSTRSCTYPHYLHNYILSSM